MNVTEEELMAYVDGELEPARCGAVEAAVAADPDLRRRVTAQRALRDRLRESFNRTLTEPLPAALVDAARAATIATAPPARGRTLTLLRVSPWLAAAASLVLGLLVGPWLLDMARGEADLSTEGSRLMARGELGRTLSTALAAEPSAAPGQPQVGLSFVSRTGHYCRTFVDGAGPDSLAGIACREQDGWRVTALQTGGSAAGSADGYRQAGTTWPPLILQAVTDQIRGEPLDASAEKAARARGWAPSVR